MLLSQVVLSFDVLDMGDIFISSKHTYEASLGTLLLARSVSLLPEYVYDRIFKYGWFVLLVSCFFTHTFPISGMEDAPPLCII